MTEAEIVQLIKRTVRLELAQTMGGKTTHTNDAYLCSIQRFALDAVTDNVRIIRPYGFVSRPLAGTPTIVHPINGDPSHLLALNDFDEGNRPAIDDGESAFYGSSGQVIFTKGTDIFIGDYNKSTGVLLPLYRAAFHEDGSYEIGQLKTVSSNASGEVFIGSPSASNPLVLGDILQSFCDQLLTILTNALQSIEAGPIAISSIPGSPAPTSPKVIADMQTAVNAIASLKSTLVDNAATNFISQQNFTERI